MNKENRDMTVTFDIAETKFKLVIYLDHTTIAATKMTAAPLSGRTQSGYGSRLPTSRMIKLDNGRWHRLYAICSSTAASFYIEQKYFGKRFIDGYSEDAILEKECG